MAQGWGTGKWGSMPWGGAEAVSRYIKILRIKIANFLSILIKGTRVVPNIETVRCSNFADYKVRASCYHRMKIKITEDKSINIKSE